MTDTVRTTTLAPVSTPPATGDATLGIYLLVMRGDASLRLAALETIREAA